MDMSICESAILQCRDIQVIHPTTTTTLEDQEPTAPIKKGLHCRDKVSRSQRILQTKLFQGAMHNVHFTISVDVTALNVSNTIRRQKFCNISSKMALPLHLLIGNRVLADLLCLTSCHW